MAEAAPLASSESVALTHAPPYRIPLLGLGVYENPQPHDAVLAALSAGYRHLDTAQIYRNEAGTGTAVTDFLAANPSIKRSDIFICTKLWETYIDGQGVIDDNTPIFTRAGAIEGFQRSLDALGPGIEYIDLYLLHTPRPGPTARLEAWLGLQEVFETSGGKARALGVSNWSKAHIEQLVAHPDVRIMPAANQIEFHPWYQQRALVEYCQQKGIVVVAYSPLTRGVRLGDPVIKQVAEKYGKTPAQVVLRWCLQRGVVVIPKSGREERIRENKGLWGWELAQEDVARIADLDEGTEGRQGGWDLDAWE
ncbi:hypothetical protein DRE_01309 [Drechslerella stenobrocha 248]|uniref:NADP-dependent oxidoreductase domain-containing protein n=1 Tax=Drechslerella stenobrocha 248 TaxID=1043628 RepID=W7HV77_9PEZI|nr:hypothetical protein DRE_01309 [Drechslerella stenobrocha 248]